MELSAFPVVFFFAKAPLSSIEAPQNPDVRTNNSGQRSGVPFKSKLAPFEPQIRQWLCDNKSYSEMAELLAASTA